MRLIDADELLKDKTSNAYISRFEIENAPTIDAEPVEYQPMSKEFARMITKGIASLLSELNLDLPSVIYEDIEHNLHKGKFSDVECFVTNYIKNNGTKMDEDKCETQEN